MPQLIWKYTKPKPIQFNPMAYIVLYIVMALHDEFEFPLQNNIIYDDDKGDYPLLMSV